MLDAQESSPALDSHDTHSMLLRAARKYLASKARPQPDASPATPDGDFGRSSPVDWPASTSRSRSQPRSRPRLQQNERAGESFRSKSQPRSRPREGGRTPDYQGALRRSNRNSSPLHSRDSRKENFEWIERAHARRSITPEHALRPTSRHSPGREGLHMRLTKHESRKWQRLCGKPPPSYGLRCAVRHYVLV